MGSSFHCITRDFAFSTLTMVSLTSTLVLAFATFATASPVAEAVAAPLVTAAPDTTLDKRATSCTFSGSSGYASASKSQASCATIVLSGITVPSGTTLDLSDLEDNTHVRCRLVPSPKLILIKKIRSSSKARRLGVTRNGLVPCSKSRATRSP